MSVNQRFRRHAVYLILVAGAVALGGCSASTGSQNDSSFAGSEESMAYSDAVGIEDQSMSELAKDGGVNVTGESVITTGSATIRTNTPDKAAKDFAARVTEMDGVITSTWQSEWDGSVSASVDAQVPADRYQELIASLPEFGKIIDQNTSRQDVGLQVTDLNARKDALVTSLSRLHELMEQATTTEELLQAEDMLTQRQAELDSLNSQLEWLTDQVDMSTVYVTFTQDSSAGSGFSWERAWDLLIDSLKFVAYALIVLVPWLIVIGLIIWLIRTLVRRSRRSKLESGTSIETADNDAQEVIATTKPEK
ncbi:DUF4349 domain-containing protein [Actinomycetaceae bacterium MB13-C1-2]|nr:DUF4349 domain-containing protein [Actinomycetaceae bacterium MB13-C1-2]